MYSQKEAAVCLGLARAEVFVASTFGHSLTPSGCSLVAAITLSACRVSGVFLFRNPLAGREIYAKAPNRVFAQISAK